MDRRRFVAAIGVAVAASLARAQQPVRLPRIGYLFSFVRSQGEHLWQACRQGMHELGYVEGRNVVLEARWADGHHDRLPTLVAELVRIQVDVNRSSCAPIG